MTQHDFFSTRVAPVREARVLTDDDVAAARARLDTLARFLDSAFYIPGTSIRVGADAALNLIPGIGTLAAKTMASYVFFEARRMGAPRSTLMRMAGNIGVDFVISAIPFVGWFGDVFYRANLRNIELLRAHLDQTAVDAKTGRASARL